MTGDNDTATRPSFHAASLNEKLAHRALAGAGAGAGGVMSAEARSRLYDRMFPKHICMGADADGGPDLLS